MEQMKKDLQKVVRAFRAKQPKKETVIHTYSGEEKTVILPVEYPKAMMTDAQMRKDTATINFGGNGEKVEKQVQDFMFFPPFKYFCEEYGCEVKREINSDNRIQLRLNY